jgi:hypothetical protein
VVIYINESCSRSVEFVTGLIRVFIGGFSGVIKCKKEWSANTIIILNA